MPDSDAPQRYRIDDLTLDVGRRVLERGGERITLTSRLFALLRVLAEGSPNVLSHDELADRAWGPRRVVTPENISQHIALLRRALGDDAASPRYIEAIRGEGYRLIPEVVPAPAPGRRRRLWPAAAGLIAIVGTVFVAGWLLGPESLDSPSLGIVEGSRAVEEPAQAADPRSLLVLPFASQSTEAEHGYFADGLSEELINRLSRIEGLLVMGRTTSFAVRASGVDAQAIGAMTGVANILEGSVRRSGDRVRIAVQLVRTADGYQIWSQAYDRGLDDVLAVQRDIAAAVADSLQATLSDETLANEFYGLPGTGNAEAYDLYLRAQGLLRASSPDDLSRAEMLLREAVDIDPEFLAAYGLLARTVGSLRFLIPERSDELLREWEEITDYISRAVPGSPVVGISRSLQLANAGDWVGAERTLAASLELLPSGLLRRETESLAGFVRRATGRYRESLELARTAVREDPLALDTSVDLQRVYYGLGQLEAAETEYQRSRDLPGGRLILEDMALMRAVVEDYPAEEVARRLERLADAMPSGAPAWLTEVVEHRNDRSAALERLPRDPVVSGSDTGLPLLIAWWADYLGDTDLALGSLNRYLEQTGRVGSYLWLPLLEQTRTTDGFKALVRDYGLLDYWRATGNWGDFCRPLGGDDFECK